VLRRFAVACVSLLLVLGVVAAAPATAGDGVLRIATEGAYPPFNFRNEAGELTGFDVDFARALCDTMNTRCELQAEPWDSIIAGLLEQRYDAIVASMSVTEARKQKVAFTDKYYSTPMRFVARRGAFTSSDQLQGGVLGAQAETTSYAFLTNGDPYGARVHAFATMEEAYAGLLAGEVDAVLTDSLVAWDFLKSDAGQPFSFVGDPIYTDTEIAIAVRKEDEALRRRFNKAIALLIIDGTYQRINQKYFPFSIY